MAVKLVSLILLNQARLASLLEGHQQLSDREFENNPEVERRTQINNQSHRAQWLTLPILAFGSQNHWVQDHADLHRKFDLQRETMSQYFFFFFQNQS